MEDGDRILRRRPQVVWEDESGRHEQSIDESSLVGSAEGNDLIVSDRLVSRVHAELTAADDGLWVRDLGSSNGTYVNEVRVLHARVPDRATLRIGSSPIHVTYDLVDAATELWPTERFGPLVGASPAMRQVFARIARIATTDMPVLIRGETGTGKELVAEALHEASQRSAQSLVIVDCAALPESLMEAELFGHARGAFTGAAEARQGVIESADGGTVLLDEIGELPLHLQPKLLRVIENKQVRRVGETQYRAVNVRFVSATHRDLGEMVNAGSFREDLFFRLAVLSIVVPPLRERPSDIRPLIEHMLPEGSAPLDEAMYRQLEARLWPGNVRELRNFVEQAVALGPREALCFDQRPSTPASAASPGLSGSFRDAKARWLAQFEREYLRDLLTRHDHNVAAAADEAGIDRTYAYRLIRRHRL